MDATSRPIRPVVSSGMRLREWIAGFRQLHQKAKSNALSPDESQAYGEGRDDLAVMLVAAQRLTLGPGETPREALRVVRRLPVEVRTGDRTVQATTLDISRGGFSAMVPQPPEPGKTTAFVLRLASGEIPGQARVANVLYADGAFRVSFKFQALADPDVARVDSEVLDGALEHLVKLTEPG
jgi:hypothetical protein